MTLSGRNFSVAWWTNREGGEEGEERCLLMFRRVLLEALGVVSGFEYGNVLIILPLFSSQDVGTGYFWILNCS